MNDQLQQLLNGLFRQAYRFAAFHWEVVRRALRPPYYGTTVWEQMDRIGVDSLSIVMLVGFFTGFVLAFQTGYAMMRFGAKIYVGGIVAVSLVRELGPVLTALMVTGRAGSAMAAELGSMRVTEQIDALVALATDPVQYLFVPRVLAAILVLPMLAILANAVGIAGGYLVAVTYLGANPVRYIENTFQYLNLDDLTSGLVKSAVFGGLLSLIGCQCGFDTVGGAEGVGRATTRAVVAGSLSVLIADFFLTKILF